MKFSVFSMLCVSIGMASVYGTSDSAQVSETKQIEVSSAPAAAPTPIAPPAPAPVTAAVAPPPPSAPVAASAPASAPSSSSAPRAIRRPPVRRPAVRCRPICRRPVVRYHHICYRPVVRRRPIRRRPMPKMKLQHFSKVNYKGTSKVKFLSLNFCYNIPATGSAKFDNGKKGRGRVTICAKPNCVGRCFIASRRSLTSSKNIPGLGIGGAARSIKFSLF